jgi:hypothetical protein
MAASLSFPSGAWTLYVHDPADTTWTLESHTRIGSFSDFPSMWGALKAITNERFLAGMFFLMKEPYMPLWERHEHIRGGSYCIKIPEAAANETFQRYAAAGVMDMISKDTKNSIVGISISPKKGFHILKLWNLTSKIFHDPTGIHIYGDGMKESEILYRAHVDQRM